MKYFHVFAGAWVPMTAVLSHSPVSSTSHTAKCIQTRATCDWNVLKGQNEYYYSNSAYIYTH